jgi:hypothetical protein
MIRYGRMYSVLISPPVALLIQLLIMMMLAGHRAHLWVGQNLFICQAPVIFQDWHMRNTQRPSEIYSDTGWLDTLWIIAWVNSVAMQFQTVLQARTHGKFQDALICKDNDRQKR